MTREELAQKIRWPSIIWFIGMVNVVAMVPQLYQIWAERRTAGLSLFMFGTILFIQLGLAVNGYFRRDTALIVTMLVSAVISVAIIGSVLYLRSFGL